LAVESEAELEQRLTAGGVEFDADDFSAALALLEGNGVGGYQTGAIRDLPYRVLRTEPKLPKTKAMPNPPRAIILDWLRPY
jgi:hypothetical protein